MRGEDGGTISIREVAHTTVDAHGTTQVSGMSRELNGPERSSSFRMFRRKRSLSRSQARKRLSADSLSAAMGNRTWNSERAEALVDEHPEAYKDIDTVMANQADLVTIEHTLGQIFNYKG